ALKAYLDNYEVIENWYGPAGAYKTEPLATTIAEAEAGFHTLMRSSSAEEVKATIAQLNKQIERIAALAAAAQVPLYPTERPQETPASTTTFEHARTPEGVKLLAGLNASDAA